MSLRVKTQIKKWLKNFTNGRTSIESDPRSGKPLAAETPKNESVRVTLNLRVRRKQGFRSTIEWEAPKVTWKQSINQTFMYRKAGYFPNKPRII